MQAGLFGGRGAHQEEHDGNDDGTNDHWLDPLNGRIVAKSIAGRLTGLFPEYADDFQENLEAFQKALDEHMFGKALVEKLGGAKLWTLELKKELEPLLKSLHLEGQLGGWKGMMRPFQGEKIITFHQSWDYLANRFNLVVADELEPKPGIPPSPGHVLEVIRKVKEQNISALAVLVLSKAPHGHEKMEAMLVGSILFVSWNDVLNMLLLYLPLGILHFIIRRVLMRISENIREAESAGISVRAWDLLFYTSFSLMVTQSVSIAGVLVVFSYLIIPAACAIMFVDNFFRSLLMAWGIALGVSFSGLAFSA